MTERQDEQAYSDAQREANAGARDHYIHVGAGIHLPVSTAVRVTMAMIEKDRRRDGRPPLTPIEMQDVKDEHARLVATFCT